MTAASLQNPKSKIQNPIWWVAGIFLLAAAFRLFAIDAAPPGWRDDELIEFAMDRRIADGWRPLFITEAEGHEPVYHYLHAGTILLFGDNIVGYKWLPMAFGLLTIALTYALAKKMFGVRVALLTAALLAVSFWPVMYSRFGVRHIGVLPWMLAAFYLLYPQKITTEVTKDTAREQKALRGLSALRGLVAGVCLAAAIMTYFAGRAVPLILIGFLIYLAVFNRSILRRVWWRYLLAIGIAALIVLPMFVEIANTPGGEKRTEVVGGPLIALRQGNLQPAIDTTLGTLGMFTFAGDPEWLYNIENRPIFDWVTGLFFYLGVIICLVRLKRIESGFALVWLFVGIAPAFVSIPAASFSHTIAALPVVYMLGALGVVWLVDKFPSRQGNKRLALSTFLLVSLFVVGLGAWLTIRDYFGAWASEYIVRFQYHAPTRAVAQWLNQNPEIANIAIGTNPNQLVLDPLALKLDMPRDIPASWFNAESALARPSTGLVVLTALQAPAQQVRQMLSDTAQLQYAQPEFEVYAFQPLGPRIAPLGGNFDQGHLILRSLDAWQDQLSPGETYTLRTYWLIDPPLSQPRLKMFLHVSNERGEIVAGDDREDLSFGTLTAPTSFWQVSRITLPADLPPGKYALELGWYNPVSSERLKRTDGSDQFLLPPLEVTAP